LTDKIRAKARELLESGQVSCFIGYEEGTRGRVRPAFVYEPEDADRLIWDERCTYNLAVYLHQFQRPSRRGEEPPRVGILLKPCDTRSLNVLLQEEQIERERVYVVGLMCQGVKVNGQPEERCLRCSERVPLVYDLVLGSVPKVVGREDYADVARLEGLPPAERLAFWMKEFDRCIRCYACRQACPACYCFECVAEQLDPQWMGIAIDLSQKQFFHVMRAYHLAGRCAGCNACEEACPMGIPLSLLNRKIAKEVEALFGYRAGQDAVTVPPLATFKKEEELPL
jgi:formate dehydrogenase subunit beta